MFASEMSAKSKAKRFKKIIIGLCIFTLFLLAANAGLVSRAAALSFFALAAAVPASCLRLPASPPASTRSSRPCFALPRGVHPPTPKYTHTFTAFADRGRGAVEQGYLGH